ncbi:YtfJ family protein [Mixta tenebrionis]|uniref:YtfJ family protein n=1 Tax=Mixta tenebrionis TaxID=2562439 RepID=A0A506VDT1_9GAMM|nr:YtfJ family protein [Mixta tenebrionis]TPW43728.1 YtfJ family protein [Mixta tenebrionis]
MTLRTALLLLGGLPFFAPAHNFVTGERVAPVGVAERGELLLHQGEPVWRSWNSARLSGTPGVVLHMAGRLSAKSLNAPLIDAIHQAAFPTDKLHLTTIVNTDDAIPGSALFVRRSLEQSKRQSPAARFVVDERGVVSRAWRLAAGGSAVVVLDRTGRVCFAKDGALTPAEVQRVMLLLRQLAP